LRRVVDFQRVERVLLVELNHFGDVVHALAAARALRQALPRARMSMLVERTNRGLVELEPSVDRVLEAKSTSTLRGLLRAIRTARQEPYDLACSLTPIRRNAWVTLAARAANKLGYLYVWRRTPSYLRRTRVSSIGLALAANEEYAMEHLSNASLKVCSALGVAAVGGSIHLEATYDGGDLIPQNSYIVFHPFAGWKYREWPADIARRFISLFLDSTALLVVLVGGTAEEDRARELSGLTRHTGRVLVRTGLPTDQLAALIQRAAAFVGTDSGPYQLCAALGKPALGLFGPNAPEITGSLVKGARVVYHRLDCSPCEQRRCVRPELPCMTMITPEEVLESVTRMLRH
jgi:heptosyltransferase-1